MRTRFAALLRTLVDDAPPWVLLLRLFFALGWLRAATEKLIDPHWWSGAGIVSFADAHDDSTLDWYAPFLDRVVATHLDTTVVAVVVLQVIAGLSLLSGRALGVGLATGLLLNFNFVAAGAVDPSAFYIVAQGALVFWLIDDRPSSASRRALIGGVGLVVVLGVLSTPLVRTLRPAAVIDDPAVMYLTFAGLALLTTIEAVRRHREPARLPERPPRRRAAATEPDMMMPGRPRESTMRS